MIPCKACGSTEPRNRFRQCVNCQRIYNARYRRKFKPCKQCGSNDLCDCVISLTPTQKFEECHCKNCRLPVDPGVEVCEICVENKKDPLKKKFSQTAWDRCKVIPGVQQSLQEIARQTGLCYEAVRQIEENALNKLNRMAIRMRIE